MHTKKLHHTHLNCHLIFLVQFEVLKYKHAHTKYFIYYYNNINWNKKCQFQEMKYLWLVNQLLTNIFQEKGTVIISFFYSLWKKDRLKVDFSPISWKKSTILHSKWTLLKACCFLLISLRSTINLAHAFKSSFLDIEITISVILN